ncbi:hypothetical protein ACE5JW_11770 [Acinetobacter radioresistens]|nr:MULTISPECIES: hypothetical protein [Acinetobacter]ENV88225.1 hypothetical protein F940_00071 [Acinetobacter radioresistens NIPH 2130]EXB84796.1 hypothetical protein J538_1872 [Acinetobacter sp. 272263]MCK4078635.1 hypothetical protein [Acinetobacter radioresistens]MCK4084925.1 hypothetical protein [Acinetobacter radioresistens]MCK4097317.1 hypothetical protein [Acinetobacter radioresistens]
MKSLFGNFLGQFIHAERAASAGQIQANIGEVDSRYDNFEMFSLGTYENSELRKRDRKTIYTTWAVMQHDPTIAAALNLQTTAALGGHESRGDVVFMTPSQKLRNGGKRARHLRQLVEREARLLMPLFNEIAFPMARYGVSYGDSYVRMYGAKGAGLLQLICNEYTEPPLIQSYEQGGRTIGYHILEKNDLEMRKLTKLTTFQMARMKMPRYTPVPQFSINPYLHKNMLSENDINKLPIVASEIGGSILYDAEEPWANVQLLLQALNSQQIADSVEQAFLTFDVSGMPPEQRKKYKAGLTQMLQSHKNNVRDALKGGDAIWSKAWHILPVWGDKQVLNAIGDMSRRSAPVNPEPLMINVRRMAGALGTDLSLLGWAEQLSGGLGDGGFFHTSAQVAQRSVHVRAATTKAFNHIANVHIGYKYGYMFDPQDLPWQFEFYSDISAASTEALTNKQTRSNTMAMFGSALGTLKELNLDRESNFTVLTKIGGCDDEEAEIYVNALEKGKPQTDLSGEDNPGDYEEPAANGTGFNDNEEDY